MLPCFKIAPISGNILQPCLFRAETSAVGSPLAQCFLPSRTEA